MEYLILILQVIMWSKIEGQQCTNFKFTEQPPDNLDCNPYQLIGNKYLWQLSTSCTVVRINETAGAFQVRWFHEDTNGTVADIGKPELFTSNINVERVLFGNQLFNTTFTNNTLGKYWCQIITEPENVYLGRGNTVTILPPTSYSTALPTCSGTITISTTICADQLHNSNIASTSSGIITPHTIINPDSYKTDSVHPISSTQLTLAAGILSITESPQSQYVVLQQSITNRGNSTYVSNDDIPVKIIAGITVSSLALVLVILLFGCLVIILATPTRRKRSALLRRLSRTNMGQLVDLSMMRPNPFYTPVMIRNSREEESYGPADIRGHIRQVTGSTECILGGASLVPVSEGIATAKNHRYVNIGVGQHDKHSRKPNQKPFLRRLSSTRHYANIDTLISSLRLAVSNAHDNESPHYENIPKTKDTGADPTYINQDERARAVTVNSSSHEYINVTVTPAASIEELNKTIETVDSSQHKRTTASSHEYINVTVTPAVSVEGLHISLLKEPANLSSDTASLDKPTS